MTASHDPSSRWVVTDAAASDRVRWQQLYAAYAEFYAEPMTPERFELVWSWIHDPAVDFGALLVRPASGGQAVGLAHYRPYLRPLAGSVGGHLDDLFVDPAARGTGAVDALFDALRVIGRARGWSKIRWITADDNHRARSKYDQVAERTMWVTYDMPLEG